MVLPTLLYAAHEYHSHNSRMANILQCDEFTPALPVNEISEREASAWA
jgi:hypothetical protein